MGQGWKACPIPPLRSFDAIGASLGLAIPAAHETHVISRTRRLAARLLDSLAISD
jgi:hypothetical protein